MQAKLHSVSPRECPEEIIREAVRVLHDGGLVALPTETVYGIAALGDDGPGQKRLTALKGRGAGEKHLTIHLADPAEASRWAAPLSRCASRLVQRYWPGPLTLVVPGLNGGTVGLRLPGRLFTRAVIREANGQAPVVMSSANLPGLPPATSGKEVMERLGDKVDLIIDSGKAELQEASTIVQASQPHLQVLRQGAITRAEIEANSCSLAIFVCTGNTCRSPMAEDLARRLVAEKLQLPISEYTNSGLIFVSAGISAMPGAPAAREAQMAVAEEGGDLSNHQSTPLGRSLLELSRFVFCLSGSHQEMINTWTTPETREKVMLLLPDGKDIPDPIGGDAEIYRKTRDRIREGITARMNLLLSDPWQIEEA